MKYLITVYRTEKRKYWVTARGKRQAEKVFEEKGGTIYGSGELMSQVVGRVEPLHLKKESNMDGLEIKENTIISYDLSRDGDTLCIVERKGNVVLQVLYGEEAQQFWNEKQHDPGYMIL